MSFARVKETGSGPLEYRLQIEGWDYEFCTSEAMVTASNGVTRLNGLQRNGLQIRERVILPEGKLEADGMKFQIVDNHGEESVTKAFNRVPTKQTYMRKNFTSGSTTCWVDNVDGWTGGDYFHIGSEAIKIGSINTSDFRFFGCTRAQLNSVEYSHYVKRNYGFDSKPLVTDIPLYMKGRRCSLHAYGEGDDLKSTGSVIWKGLINEEPRDEQGKYIVSAGHISTMLDHHFGMSQDEIKLRGIYFPSTTPWEVVFYEYNSSDITDSKGPILNEATASVSGFFEDVYELAEAMNEDILLKTSGFSGDFGCRVFPNNELAFTFSTDGAAPKAALAITNNGLRETNEAGFDIPVSFCRIAHAEGEYFWEVEAGAISDTPHGIAVVEADKEYVIRTGIGGATAIPVAFPNVAQPYYTQYSDFFTRESGDDTSVRLYLGTETLPVADDITVFLKGEDFSFNMIEIYSTDATNRYVEGDLRLRTGPPDWTSHTAFVFTDATVLVGMVATFGGARQSGSVADLMERVTELSPDNVTNGLLPFITKEDFDTQDALTTFSGVFNYPFIKQRFYHFVGKGMKLGEIVYPDLICANCAVSTTSEGKLTFKQFTLPSPTEAGLSHISYSDLLTDNGYPSLHKTTHGLYAVASIKTEYDIANDEYEGDTFTVKHEQAYETFKGPQSLLIEPKSTFAHESLNRADVVNILRELVLHYGLPYNVYTFDVPMKYFDKVLYDSISITNDNVPNALTAKRGVSQLRGTLIGRTWDLETGRGTFEMFASDLSFSGYTPSAVVVTASLAGGTDGGGTYIGGTWTLTVSSSHYAPEGTFDPNFFNAGDEVRLIEWDAYSPQSASVSVDSVTTNEAATLSTIVVDGTGQTFPSNLGAANRFTLQYASSGSVLAGSNAADQLTWVFIGSGSLSPEGHEQAPGSGLDNFGP